MRIAVTLFHLCCLGSAAAFAPATTTATTTTKTPSLAQTTTTSLSATRREWGQAVAAASWLAIQKPQMSQAQVFFDPAMYGDQELRVSAVDSVKERVRRAILSNPSLAPSFYHLSLLDGLSFQANTQKYGPDGTVLYQVLGKGKTEEAYMKNLQEAAVVLLETEKFLRQKNAISLADAVAIGGAEAIESVGGPVLTVQLGRMDTTKNTPINTDLPLNLFQGTASPDTILRTFRAAGVTDRELVALLCGLYTLESVKTSRDGDAESWKASARPKFRERGKMGRMSEFRKLTDEDLAEAAAQAELEADPEYEDPDDGWYIADSFGTRESRFGQRLAADVIDEKTFNKYIQTLVKRPKSYAADTDNWVEALLLDVNRLPTGYTQLQKYASANLAFTKDLNLSYNAVTKLGAVYTGGKYENLLNPKASNKRKSLNDDDLNLF